MKIKVVLSVIAVSSLMLVSPMLARADENIPSGQGGRHPRLEKMKAELGLSEEQAQKVKELFQQGRGKCQAITDEDERELCRVKNRQEMKKSMKSVLNESQIAKLEEMKKNRREERGALRPKFCEKHDR